MTNEEILTKSKKERLGLKSVNYQGYKMEIVDYNTSKDIKVKFENGTLVNTSWTSFKNGKTRLSINHLNETKVNNDGELMKIIKFNSDHDIVVRFIESKYDSTTHTGYDKFKKGVVKNHYTPTVHGHGIVGNKYKTHYTDGKSMPEYAAWEGIIRRSFSKRVKENNPTYKDVTCCDDWLLFENFYEWLHNQENFIKWLNGERWAVDKDILIKGNKTYSPNTCCLVSNDVNILFNKRKKCRGEYYIGVALVKIKGQTKYRARCDNPITQKKEQIGNYNTPEEAFYAYKKYKEGIIKKVAQKEFDKGNIIKSCYEAMMNYNVEITD